MSFSFISVSEFVIVGSAAAVDTSKVKMILHITKHLLISPPKVCPPPSAPEKVCAVIEMLIVVQCAQIYCGDPAAESTNPDIFKVGGRIPRGSPNQNTLHLYWIN